MYFHNKKVEYHKKVKNEKHDKNKKGIAIWG